MAVKAIDDGIEIHSLAFCFQYMENCKSFDLAKFDMSNCTNLQHAFAYCGNATSFSISSWDTSSVVEFDSALKNLYKVEEIDISRMVDAESRRFTSPFFHRQFAEKREIWTRVEDLRCYGYARHV